ncbi:sigma-70 family RNA polymerase sigma factor [Streptomyces sp. NPDC048279]|uniref:sigma-70 family RNA polymerase sigma factor n=1 Tax=Streptomyces sp. NPDC048279 TaxID=3154714 RepID=UPI003442C55E
MVQVPGAADDAECERFIRTVYEEHGVLLLRFADRLLGGDWHRAEDILQEAAVRAWKHVGVLGHQDEGLRPWLFTVVRNLVTDDYRARLIRPVNACSVDDVALPVTDWIDQTLTWHVINEALANLSEQQREILHHMYFLGSSVAQTSQSLGIPRGTVKSRTHYAVRALRRALQARGIDEQSAS